MSKPNQVAQVTASLNARLDAAIVEFDLTVAEIIGILEVIKLEVYERAKAQEKDD